MGLNWKHAFKEKVQTLMNQDFDILENNRISTLCLITANYQHCFAKVMQFSRKLLQNASVSEQLCYEPKQTQKTEAKCWTS
jgi:hypothetical protein